MQTLLKKIFCVGILLIQTGVIHAAVVIQYHHVDEHTPASTSVMPERFAEHMAYLANNGFKVWPLPRLVKALQQAETIPDKVIAITFDDGYQSVYRQALPVLQRYHYPFTVFINPELVGGSGYMNWDELRVLAKQAGTIANHTASHPHLIRFLPNETGAQWQLRIQHEITDAEKIIQKKIGYTPGLLAYPYGEYDHRVEQIVRSLGLVAFAQNSAAFDQSVNWQAIPRFAFGGRYTEMKGFIDKVNSLPMPLVDAYVSDERGQRLSEPLLPINMSRPIVTLQLKTRVVAQAIHCFASGQGKIVVQRHGNSISTQPTLDLPVGRSRINCTAASGQPGRFYWYSEFFMRKQPDDSWYKE